MKHCKAKSVTCQTGSMLVETLRDWSTLIKQSETELVRQNDTYCL